MNRTISLFAFSTMLLAGCANEGVEPAFGPEETPVQITEVRTMPDGTQQVRTAEWSRAEMRKAVHERERLAEQAGVYVDAADADARAAGEGGEGGEGGERVGEASQAIYVDRLCGNTALWITDNGTYGDINHMICFDDAGFIAMPLDWVGAFWGGVHTPVELWGGARSGRQWFVNSGCDAGCSVPFGAWEKKNLQTYPGPSSRFDGVSLD